MLTYVAIPGGVRLASGAISAQPNTTDQGVGEIRRQVERVEPDVVPRSAPGRAAGASEGNPPTAARSSRKVDADVAAPRQTQGG
jgi:hypothetical protein